MKVSRCANPSRASGLADHVQQNDFEIEGGFELLKRTSESATASLSTHIRSRKFQEKRNMNRDETPDDPRRTDTDRQRTRRNPRLVLLERLADDGEPAIPGWFDRPMEHRLAPYLARVLEVMHDAEVAALVDGLDAAPAGALVIRQIDGILWVAGRDRVPFLGVPFDEIANLEVMQ